MEIDYPLKTTFLKRCRSDMVLEVELAVAFKKLKEVVDLGVINCVMQ